MLTREYTFDQKISSAMASVYAWMCCALAVTASAAYYVATNHDLFMYVQQPGVMIALFFGQLAFVIGLSFFLNRISYATALALFLLYSFTLGITLSSIFYVYTHASIVSTFLSTACMFGVMSLYGYATRSDLTSMGNLAVMMLVGMMIGMMVNMFLQSAQLDYIFSLVGVVLFVLLTAYDTQKIKHLMQRFANNDELMSKVAIFGALTLYLDFINLFLFLLRFMGKRSDR